MSYFTPSDYDPYMLAEQVGQEYNPYQGYPLKQVSDQIWDVYGPTPDYLIAQLASQMNPNPDQFSTDAFFGADPLLRGPLAEALSNAKGDTIGAYNYLQDPEFTKRLTKEIGRTEWDQIAGRGDLASLAAMTGEEKDKAALDYYRRGLEDLMAQGAPSRGRQLGNLDYIREREGGMAKPGTGDYPSYGGGQDPMAALYGGGAPSQVDIQDVGRGGELDRMDFDQASGQAMANIGGRRYAVRGLPTDRIALQQVIMDRRKRMREGKGEEQMREPSAGKRGAVGRGVLNGLLPGFGLRGVGSKPRKPTRTSQGRAFTPQG